MKFDEQKKESIEVYSRLVEEYGDDPRSSHWTNIDSQLFRFNQLCKIANLNGKSILDIGCGIGDLYKYLQLYYKNFAYTGLDINPQAISLAKEKYTNATFHMHDLTLKNENEIEIHDFVIMSGIFNNSFLGVTDYLEELVEVGFKKSKSGLAFNFISNRAQTKDKAMAYHDPLRVFSFCLENLSEKVVVNHKYERADVSIFIYH